MGEEVGDQGGLGWTEAGERLGVGIGGSGILVVFGVEIGGEDSWV